MSTYLPIVMSVMITILLPLAYNKGHKAGVREGIYQSDIAILESKNLSAREALKCSDEIEKIKSNEIEK